MFYDFNLAFHKGVHVGFPLLFWYLIFTCCPSDPSTILCSVLSCDVDTVVFFLSSILTFNYHDFLSNGNLKVVCIRKVQNETRTCKNYLENTAHFSKLKGPRPRTTHPPTIWNELCLEITCKVLRWSLKLKFNLFFSLTCNQLLQLRLWNVIIAQSASECPVL